MLPALDSCSMSLTFCFRGADNIESGERVNFILWSVSETYRNSEAKFSNSQRVWSEDGLRFFYIDDENFMNVLTWDMN